MNRDLRMILMKRLVNVPLRFVDLLLAEPLKTEFPQSRMLEHVFARMGKVYRLDVAQGTFSVRRGAAPDGNFERLLRVSRKVLVQLCEDDPYYRKWVGLGLLLCSEEWAAREKDPRQLKRWIKRMWHMDIDCLPDELISVYVDNFAEDMLCDFLGNLARMEVGYPTSLDQTKKMEEKLENEYTCVG
jgi:hypothetical protein